MNSKFRCTSFNNECNDNNCGWKIVEATSQDAEIHRLRKERLVPCLPKEEEKCPKQIVCCRGDKGEKGDIGPKGEPGDVTGPIGFNNTLVFAVNPMTDYTFQDCFGSSGDTNYGGNSMCDISTCDIPRDDLNIVTFTCWDSSKTIDAINSFNANCGTYTAPQDGDYIIELVVNYQITEPISVDPSFINVPTIEIYDNSNQNVLLSAGLPANNFNIMMPISCCSSSSSSCNSNPFCSSGDCVTILVSNLIAKGQVIIKGVVTLEEGQNISIRFDSKGLLSCDNGMCPNEFPTMPAVIDFSPSGLDTTLTIYKIRNTPSANVGE